MNTLAVLGCGNIGSAIIEGLLSHEGAFEREIYATTRNPENLKALAEKGVNVGSDNLEAVSQAQYIIIAMKPYKVEEVLKEISPQLRKEHVLISVASEIDIETIRKFINVKTAVFRAMPNTAAEIQESITCISGNDVTEDQIKEVEYLFSGIGRTIVIDEEMMSAATILGACGIAYVMRFIRAMIQGGIQLGFDTKTASLITNQTVKGAADLLLKKGNHPEIEIDKVTTPKGCTITGLNEMEHQGFSSALIKGIVKSFDKIDRDI